MRVNVLVGGPLEMVPTELILQRKDEKWIGIKEYLIFRLSSPKPEVALAWGSKSHRRTFRPSSCSAAVRFTAEGVFPTPPFWLTTAMIFPIFLS